MNPSPPAPRTLESLRHHFEVEKSLATRLRNSTRQERAELFKVLYEELFRLVPDHPRLTRVDQAAYQARVASTQMRLLKPVLDLDKVVVEFAPGDCHLARVIAPHVKQVIGVDISDQRTPGEQFPSNFQLLVYDGSEVPMAPGSADAVFSYQFLEHLHPDDIAPHFELAASLLKPGGVYIFDTPHRLSGPHDIAGAFGNDLVCLHMQEWTYRELRRRVQQHGFGQTFMYRRGKPVKSGLLNALNDMAESMIGLMPQPWRRKVSRRLFTGVTMLAVKT
jgi:SAM-dependent methyltransferase